MEYQVLQDGGFYDKAASLDAGISLAEGLLDKDGAPTTFTVEDANGKLMASVTNRRIIGMFTKQEFRYGGRCYEPIEEIELDVTDSILLMDHEKVVAIRDNTTTTDEIGRMYVYWGGPFRFDVTDSVCEYFGVDRVTDITPEALAYARNAANPAPPKEVSVTLTLKVKLRVAPGARIGDFANEMDYSIESNTGGIVVLDTEVVDAE